MAWKRRRRRTPDEVSGQHAAERPRREALSLVFGSVGVPPGLVGAAGAASSQSAAAATGAEAEQVAEVVQES